MINKSLRVLMIDDSEIDSLLAVRHLSQGGYSPITRREEDEAGTQAALSEQTWDVLLCDSSMPGFGAGRALDLLRKMNLEIPLIVVSGTTGEEAAAAAIRHGAADWVSKRDLSRLVPVVEKHVDSDLLPLVTDTVTDVPGPVVGGSALHSFNNALSVVLTYASVLLNETHRNNPIRADLEEIERAANTAAALAAGLFRSAGMPRMGEEDLGRREALALVKGHLRKEPLALKCEVCGGGNLKTIEYRTPSLRAPALECERCKAIKLDETVAQSAEERESVRDALVRRATVVSTSGSSGIVHSSAAASPRALQDVCDEIGLLLATAQSALQSLPPAAGEPAERVASTERAMSQIAALVESLRSAI